MTEKQWLKVLDKINSGIAGANRIVLLDVLIQFIKEFDVKTGYSIKSLVYRLYNEFKINLISMLKFGPDCHRGAVFFFAVEPTHLTQMTPVADLLMRRSIPVIFVTTRSRIYLTLAKQKRTTYLLDPKRGNGRGRSFLMGIKEMRPWLPQPETDVGLAQLIRLYPEVAALEKTLISFLDYCSPSYVLVGNDITWEGRLLARLASLLKIRTGMIQHGLLGNETYNRYHIIDDFYVYGNAFRDILVQDGFEESKILVTGAPYLDSRALGSAPSPNPLIANALDLRGQFVLIALSGPGHRTTDENYELTLTWLDKLIRNHAEVDFVIKLHRKEKISAYAIFEASQRGRIVDRTRGRALPQDIFEWLKGCSCLITGTSTVAYEAMYWQIPVISVDPLKEFRGVNYIDTGVVEVAHTFEDLDAALLKVDGQRRAPEAFVRNVFLRSDIPAAERIVNHIQGFVKVG